MLLQQYRPEAFLNITDKFTREMHLPEFLDAQGPGNYSFQGQGVPRCPDSQFNETVVRGSHGLDALQLLPEDSNAWCGEFVDANYTFPGDHASCSVQDRASNFSQVYEYADSLGWDRSGVLFRPSRNGEYVDPALCQDMPYNSSPSSNRPMQGVKLYASLRFQCSSLSKGMLCDFGVCPPLAVSPDGTYLSKRNMPDLPDVVIFSSPPTATAVKWAVIGMVIAALVSNIFSAIFLWCWPRLRGCADKYRKGFGIRRDACSDSTSKRDV